jgi:hypothetical protein
LKIASVLNRPKREIVQDVRFIKDKNGNQILMIYCNKNWTMEQMEVET